MAPDKLSRDPGSGDEESSEAVRIIAAEELEEVTERREVARRRAPDEPGFKDRPAAPPDDVRPAIRFPLPDSADASSVERPRPAPVEPSRAEASGPERSAEPTPVFLGEPPEASDPGGTPPDVDQLADVDQPVDVVGAADVDQPADVVGAADVDQPADVVGTADVDQAVDVVGTADAVEVPEPPPWVLGDEPALVAEPPSGDPGAPPAEDQVPAPFDQAADEREPIGEPTAAASVAESVAEEVGTPGQAPFDQAADELAPAVEPAPPQPDDEAPAASGAPASDEPVPSSPPTSAPGTPVLDLGPSSGEHRLPHWTEPPTGEVPRVVTGGGDVDDAAEDERWASFSAGSTRWRDEHDTSEHGDLVADLAASPDEPVAERLGALDTSDRLSDDAFLNFDDVELDPSRRRSPGTRRRRGERREQPPPSAPDHDPLAAIISVDEPVPEQPPAAQADAPRADAPRSRSGRTARAAGLGNRAPAPPPELDPAAPRSRRRPPSDGGGASRAGGGRNVPQAVVVGGALAIAALLALWAGPAVALVLVEIVVVLAGAEYFGAVQRGGFRPATLLGLTAVAALPLAAYWRGEAAFPLVLFLVFAVGVLWYLLGVGGPVRPTANLGVTLLGVVWVGVLGAFAALILAIPSQGPSILLVAIVSAVAHDAGGFFIGRAMGRTPLTSISPGKTVEGLVGGVLSALVAVFVVAVMLGAGPFSAGEALVFGLLTALVAPFGDLAESLFKRDLGLKDMGSILPQHGGVLDRFDAMLFVLPTAYYVVRVLDLAG